MKDSKKLNNKKKSFAFLIVVGLGIGFAFLSTQLNINGTTNVLGSKWSVYFDNIQVSEGSMEAELPTIDTNKTTVDFEVTLANPGDFYEFTVDAKNDGTIDAMIESISMTELSSNVLKYLNYEVTYEEGGPIARNDVLEAKTSTTYKVLVEFKKDVVASDLSEENTSLNLSFSVNYVQSTIKTANTFLKVARYSALSDNSIDFTKMSSDTNGKGLYLLSETRNDTNPIYYYRGAVENNNALFAGYCWKIVRTTETGGTKLVYNGLPGRAYQNVERLDNSSYVSMTNDQTYPYTFDTTSKEWKNSNETNYSEVVFIFSVEEAGDYILNYNLELPESLWGEVAFYKDGVELARISGARESKLYFNDLEPSNVIKISYWNYSNVTISMDKGVGDSVVGCTNTIGEATQLTKSKFNENDNSIAYAGYMYGTVYEVKNKSTTSSDLYGNSFTYSNGTYTLSNTQSGADSTHHYTCFNSTGICEQIAYVHYLSYSTACYIPLTEGKSIEDVLEEMLSESSNTNNSTIKTTIDNWFGDTFTTYFTNKGKNYNDYLEDTIWCNDRTVYNYNGLNPNGENFNTNLSHGGDGREENGTPTLICPNKNDAFTVSDTTNGNGKLTYPVGLLTSDEIMLAGGQNIDNSSYYLYTNQYWWSMTPKHLGVSTPYNFLVYERGELNGTNVNGATGVRPSISLKSSVKVREGGNGTAVTPYEFVVE